jgi:hypothetical protein
MSVEDIRLSAFSDVSLDMTEEYEAEDDSRLECFVSMRDPPTKSDNPSPSEGSRVDGFLLVC